MKKSLLFLLVAAVALSLVSATAVYAQRNNVTFLVNTATVPDTLRPSSVVVITGSGTPHDADSMLTSWGSGIPFTNVGGDYWTATGSFATGDTLIYKIRIGSGGWEKDLSDGDGSGGHRKLIVTQDTTLPVQFWNNRTSAQPMFFRPWTAVPDSFINVYFRVNMKAVMDNNSFGWTPADVDSVGVRGDGKGGDLDWGTTAYLTQEQTPGDGAGQFTIPPTSFFSGRLKFRKSTVNVGDTIQYKFLLGSNWGRDELGGGRPNRIFTIPVGKADTTLQWVFYDNTAPVARDNVDSVVVTWRVDMTTARNKGSFNIGDTLQVQVGFYNTADSQRTITLGRVGLTNIYTATSTMKSSVAKTLDYQYYLVKNAQSLREVFYNFDYTGGINAEKEKRQVTVPGTGAFTILDTANSQTSGRRQPYWQTTRNLAHNMTVTWTVDMRPAYYQVWAGSVLIAGQGTDTVRNVDSIKVWGVAINGPATGGPNGPLSTDWATWSSLIASDTSARKMWDDGTHGDKTAHDSVYSVIFHYTTTNIVGQVFKFGIGGSDNEGGFGNNHVENIVDIDTVYTVASDFGSIDPKFYSAWDFDLHKPKTVTGITTLGGLPLVYKLEQNYPNPFNPSTKIEFALPKQSPVELKVFNILGQEVATLVHETLGQGNHIVTFDAKNLASGLYFYRITAGTFTSVKKMMLVK